MIYQAEDARRGASTKYLEVITQKGEVDGTSLFVIENVRDSNIRETTGFAFNKNLYLWPEEAYYLLSKCQAECLPGLVTARSDVSCFYNFMRRENLFLTRDHRFKDFKEAILDIKPEEPSAKRVKTGDD